MRYLQLDVNNWNDWIPELLETALNHNMIAYGYTPTGTSYIKKNNQFLPYTFEYAFDTDLKEPSIEEIKAYLKKIYFIDVNIEEIIID